MGSYICLQELSSIVLVKFTYKNIQGLKISMTTVYIPS